MSDGVIKSRALSEHKGDDIVKGQMCWWGSKTFFLTAEESRPKVEKFEVEIILQKSIITPKKNRMSGAEFENS